MLAYYYSDFRPLFPHHYTFHNVIKIYDYLKLYKMKYLVVALALAIVSANTRLGLNNGVYEYINSQQSLWTVKPIEY